MRRRRRCPVHRRGTAAAACYHTVGPDGQPLLPTLTISPPARAAGWDGEQTANAAVIVAVGAELNVPPRGWVIALATAMQESGLRNLPGGDRDSIGLFQQRPSQGWGTPAQLRDPATRPASSTRHSWPLTGGRPWR